VPIQNVRRGDKPADFPVQAASDLQMVVNLKAAKALGLTVPPGPARGCRRGDRMRRQEFIARAVRKPLARVPAGLARGRLRERPESDDRIPLGRVATARPPIAQPIDVQSGAPPIKQKVA